jgi:hypothetical protein
MKRVGGFFHPGLDHSFCNARDGQIVGGFVCAGFMGTSMQVHMAGTDEKWCSRELLWLLFDYAFVELGCTKLIAPVPSWNQAALRMDLRAGWRLEAVLSNVTPDGDLMLLTMTRDECPWLKQKAPDGWRVRHKREAG